MDGVPAGDTRARILATALDLFAERGYQHTSLREIAERLRLTKAAILYHYPTKEHLLAALAEPLLADLEAVLDRAERLPAGRARWAVVEGWVDTMLAHRRPLGLLFHDVTLISRGSVYQRLWRIAMRANDLVAGPTADRRERVRAVQAIAMVSDPVVFFADVPVEVLRADMLDGVHRLLDPSPGGDEPIPSSYRRRRLGRPRALTGEKIEAARRMYETGSHTVDEIAHALGVSRATVYRHVTPSTE
ncbi:MAG TPA: TetR family transcriptional regulator [Micromonosporaceae bacterium]|nr:TetR family transcriptional regulator [Micromonosporaceae bacterium]